MSKLLIRHHFNPMLPLGSEDLVPSDSAVVSKCRFCAAFPVNGCRGPWCMGPLLGDLPDDLFGFPSLPGLTFLILLVRCDLFVPSLIQHNHFLLCIILYIISQYIFYFPC